MAPKKKAPLTKDDKLHLATAAGLCLAKAILESETELLGLAGPALGREIGKLAAQGGANFLSLIQNAHKQDKLPQLRKAFAKVIVLGDDE